MYVSKQQASVYRAVLLSLASKREKEIVKEYEEWDKAKAKGLYFQILSEIKQAISVSNIDNLKKFCKLIAIISNVTSKVALKSYYNSDINPIKSTNLIILACKYNSVEALGYIFDDRSTILANLSVDIGVPSTQPDDKDDECHNSFYYAIRSSNIELLDMLIKKWPNYYFDAHLDELDKILSKSYEEIKLKNIMLLGEMEFFVENKLINLRFFSKDLKPSFDNTKERIKLVLEIIDQLEQDYLEQKNTREKFLFSTKFIAQSIHVLKRQLKPTYAVFPWEEMELCLIIFIKSQTTRQELNLIYNSVLTEKRVLNHLKNFAIRLNTIGIQESDVSNILPNVTHDKIANKIIDDYPPFQQLYNDYEEVADVYFLEKLSVYIDLALKVNPKQENDCLVIRRSLQIIAEYLKNTLESPKLSSTTGEFLLVTASTDTSKIIRVLNSSLIYDDPFSTRSEDNFKLFGYLQNDLQKIGAVATKILLHSKIKACRKLLKSIMESTNVQEMRGMAQTFSYIQGDDLTQESFLSLVSSVLTHTEIIELVKTLYNIIGWRTDYERALFEIIYEVTRHIEMENKSRGDIVDHKIFSKLLGFGILATNIQGDNTSSKGIMKSFVKTMLKNISPKIKHQDFKEIVEIVLKILRSVKPRLPPHIVNEIDRLVFQIFYVSRFEVDDVEWIKCQKGKLPHEFVIPEIDSKLKQQHADSISKDNWKSQLGATLSTLKDILQRNGLNNGLIKSYSSYKNDKKLQATVDMLVQDIVSILESGKHILTGSMLFLGENYHLLTGKALHEHLSHGHALIDILSFDPSTAILSVARKLASETMITDNKAAVDTLPEDVPSKLKDKYYQDLQLIVNQEAMFKALEEGDLKTVENCIQKGADLNARNINLWTALHFAAEGPNLDVLNFIFSQKLTSKTADGQSPLHIAAARGMKTIVEYFIKERDFKVDDINNNKQTPLHLAAQNGCTAVVEFLLKAGAKTCIKDKAGFLPLLYATTNNHKAVLIMLLLEKEESVDANQAMGGFTPLHLAAEYGYLEIVHYLIQNKANVNAKNDYNRTPLHGAAQYRHLEIAQTLILNRADVKAQSLCDKHTPLHFAIENNDVNMTELLLAHGAGVNDADIICDNVPLHCAAEEGYIGIVEILLKYKYKVSVVNADKMTALHFAATAGHKEIVDILIKNNASVTAKNVHGFTALHLSSLQGHRDIVELLIKRGANIHAEDKRKRTPLHLAGMSGHEDILELLIASGANVNAVDINHDTTLHLSCANGYKHNMELLMKSGAKIEAKNIYGCTPLHLASGDSFAIEMVKMILQSSTGIPNIHYTYEKNYELTGNTSTSVRVKRSTNQKISKFLLDHGANVHTKCKDNFTPLHLAVLGGDAEVVETLIDGKAKVNVKGHGMTPLHAAVHGHHKEVTEILLKNGSNINAKDDDGNSPLFYAFRFNFKEIVELLIAKGADVTNNMCLLMAGTADFQNIVGNLSRNEKIYNEIQKNVTLMHVAAIEGLTGIVEVLIANGSDINATTDSGYTPLHLAAQRGHKEVVKVLLAKKANLNPWSDKCGTPLHVAVTQGHDGIVDILLNSGANIYIKDHKNKTAILLATGHGHLRVVKTLLQYGSCNINVKSFLNCTALHFASKMGNLGIVKYLIQAGADIDAKNVIGAKPVHMAAIEGHVHIVQFFLDNGCHISDFDESGCTVFHHAIFSGQIEIVKHLLKQTVDINPVSFLKPLHLAILQDDRDIVQILLRNGAMYNDATDDGPKPINLAKSHGVIKLLTSIENLFKAVKRNRPLDVEMHIKEGAFVDTKNASNVTSLHYASWRGYKEVVYMLLKHQANPNVVGKSDSTPLHYAAKFSHLEVVKLLLSSGAKFNVLSCEKTPADFASDQRIVDLLKLTEQLFKKVQNCDPKVIDDLKRIKNTDIMKPILNARNRDGNTIMVAAIRNDFPKIENFRKIFEEDDYIAFHTAITLLSQEKYQAALDVFESIFKRRTKLLGPDNPCTLSSQCYVAQALYNQENYIEAMSMLQEIHEKQKAMLGRNNKDTWHTRKCIALVRYGQGQDEEALEVYKEVFREQRGKLEAGDPEILDTQLKMHLVLNRLERYDDALRVNYEVLERQKETIGASHPLTLSVQDNIALVLSNQGKYDKALEIHKKVFELRSKILGSDHLDTLNTQFNIANVLFHQEKFVSALQAFKDSLNKRSAILGPVHPSILDTFVKMEMIKSRLKSKGYDGLEVLTHIRKDFFVAIGKGDVKVIQNLINEGVDVNARNIDNRTPLHVAANCGHKDVVSLLLKNGADATEVANKGNTALHFATSRGSKETVEILLQHMKLSSYDKYDHFLNARTTVLKSTSLHVAVKYGFFEIIKCLLKHGAKYNVRDESNKVPLDYAENKNIKYLLNLTNQVFACAEKGNNGVVNELNQINSGEFVSIINAQNTHGQTAVDVALRKKNLAFVNMIIEIMEEKSI